MAARNPTRSSKIRSSALSFAQAKKQTRRHPKDASAWHALGVACLQKKRFDEARTAFEHAVGLAPNSPDYHAWLGHALYLNRENDTALVHLDRAQQENPDSVLALGTRTRIHLDRNEESKALECIRRAAELAPNNNEIQALLGQTLNRKHEYDEAIRLFKRLIEREPLNYHHQNNLGNAYRDLALIDEAIQCYRHAAELNPADPLPFSNWITALHYDPHADRDAISQLAREWQARFAPSDPPIRPEPADKRLDKKLRLGMLSDGFRQHPVGKMIVRCLENLNSTEFELFAYTSNDARDPLTGRIKAMCQQWLPIQHLSDDELAQRIRDDQIDIFFDLSGHNAGTRMRAVAMQPAPLIVKWVGGLINTTGVEAIDYLISDSIETPAGEDAFYSEKLIRMPNDYIVFDPPTYTPETAELPALTNGYVTLGCFNNPSKLNEVVIGQWAEILKALPGSKLMLKGRPYTQSEFCNRIYSSFENNGIERDRIILEGPGNNRELLEAYNRVDIALDPWPYSGGLTTCESFLMGVPVVTLPGPTFAGRHSATHLINAGMPELVVASWEEYRARVIELAEDLDNLATIRRLLRRVLLESPVCNGPVFAEQFTDALRAIWQRACENRQPAALYFDDQNRPQFADDNEPVVLQRPEPIRSETAFDWQFQGKIIALDSGGHLIGQRGLDPLLAHKTIELVVFDPSGQAKNASMLQQTGVHYYADTALGDGKPATLHACLDASYSSLLEPLGDPSLTPEEAQARQVLARLPIPTVQLDCIEGLPRIDWLVLDSLSDAAAILEHGRATLGDTLLIQAKVAFQPTHARQPNLAELQHWASRNGFRFYRLHESHHGRFMGDGDASELPSSALMSADALFVPDPARIAALSSSNRMKLAFLLHTVFGIRDFPYSLISGIEQEAAARYLANVHPHVSDQVEPSKAQPSIAIPEAPHMTNSERDLFASALKNAQSYFEYGSGGSSVWAANQDLIVHGVDSDPIWIDALKSRLKNQCRLKAIDIGPTGEWGYPKSAEHAHKFSDYSKSIFEHKESFDLILVDGRFRVACTIAAIQHTLRHSNAQHTTRIFIHDFWERPYYHCVLEFLEVIDRADSAGLFRIKPNVSTKALTSAWNRYARVVQ